MQELDLVFLFIAALLGGLGHCVGMCGGIVVAYSSSKLSSKHSHRYQLKAHLAYSLGRVSTYGVIGVISGLAGAVIAFTPTTKGVLFIITGILMIVTAVSLLGGVRFLTSVECSVSHLPWYQRAFRRLMEGDTLKSFYLLGIFNGMIPCGLVYSFAIVAASTASPFWGGVVMIVFGIATIPSLFFLGTLTRYLQKGGLRGIMMKLSAVLVLLYGAFLLYKGYRFVRYPDEMAKSLEQMYQAPDPKFKQYGGMKCAPGKCG